MLLSNPNLMCKWLQLANVAQHCSVQVNDPSTLITLILALDSIQDKYFTR